VEKWRGGKRTQYYGNHWEAISNISPSKRNGMDKENVLLKERLAAQWGYYLDKFVY
jgi:hypothetical protein